MPIPKHELLKEIEELGLAYVPFTFPTATIRAKMEKALVPISNGEVDILWNAYYKGTTTEKLLPFGGSSGSMGANGAILNYIATTTNLGKMKSAAFLNALFEAVQEGRDIQYLNPQGKIDEQAGHYSTNPIESIKTALKDTGTAVGGFLKPVADPITNLVKYAAIAVVAGAAIYGIYKFSPLIKKKFKKGKR